MLILTRRPGESLHLGDDIKITILSLHGKQVKIGLSVPGDMTVFREEVYLCVTEENRRASETSTADLMAVAQLWQKK